MSRAVLPASPRPAELRRRIAAGTNIDHRRVPDLLAYFRRAGLSQPLTHRAADYLPGELVAWNLRGGILHIGIVSDRRATNHVPLVTTTSGPEPARKTSCSISPSSGIFACPDVAGS